jgi:soluble lytic murein transglycosylase
MIYSLARKLTLPIVLCITAIAVAACNEADRLRVSQPVETAIGAPSIAPEPTKPPPDPELAAELRGQGDFEAAIEVYAAIAGATDGDTRQEARLAQAQLLDRAQRYEEASDVLRAYVGSEGAGSPASAAQFLLARSLSELGDDAGALSVYERYIAGEGAAADYARAERAKLLARAGRSSEAELAAREALAGILSEGAKQSLSFAMGAAFDEAGDGTLALAWYEEAARLGDPASALARSGAVRKRLGDPGWVSDYQRVVSDYPASGPAAGLLDTLDEAGVGAAEFTRGYVYYRAFRDSAARAAFERAIAAGDQPAESAYYVAALDERTGDTASAIEGYRRSVEIDPRTPLADDALWWRGRLLESAGRSEEARADYDRLVAEYPQSEWRADADFHGGLISYRRGDYATAAASWASFAETATEDELPRARFWHGLALLRAGDPAGDVALRALAAEAPDDFYGLRAQVLVGENDDDPRDADLDDEPVEWDAIFASIATATGTDPRTAPVTALTDPRWPVATELDAVGLRDEATGLFLAIVRDHDGDPVELAQIAREIEHDDLTSVAARAAVFLRRSLPDGAEPHPELLRVAYPLAYARLVADAAESEDISPLLLLALVRQESFYDPDAGSSAGALGLTQVIPPTGEAIADALGIDDFTVDDLFRPQLSLRFGANYIGSQLRAFDENPYHALAAYNGGPGTAANAIETAGDDIDLFVEDLEFDETRLYVKLVMENYARYRHLYEGLDAPSLPQ